MALRRAPDGRAARRWAADPLYRGANPLPGLLHALFKDVLIRLKALVSSLQFFATFLCHVVVGFWIVVWLSGALSRGLLILF